MNYQRRTFVLTSIAGGLGVAIAPTTTPASTKRSPNVCTAKPSPADALESYSKLLLDLQIEVDRIAMDETNTLSRQCSDMLKDLSEKVRDLEKALPRESRAQVQRIKDLTDISAAQIKLAHAAGGGAPGYAATLALISERLESETNAMLPERKLVLSETATRLLRELITLVRKSTPVQVQLSQAQEAARIRIADFRSSVRTIEGRLQRAARSVDVADNSNTPAAEAARARAEAVKETNCAIADLATMKTGISGLKRTEVALDIIDTMTSMLDGVSKWIERPEVVTALYEGVAPREVMFEKTSTRASAARGLPAFFAARLEHILESHCGRGSSMRASACDTLILKPIQLKLWFGMPPQNKVPAIESALRRIVRYTPVCRTASNLRTLAEALASLI